MSEKPVIPAKAGIQDALGPRLRGDDGVSSVIPAKAGIQDALGPRLRGDDGARLVL
jgi:hypothetical protein